MKCNFKKALAAISSVAMMASMVPGNFVSAAGSITWYTDAAMVSKDLKDVYVTLDGTTKKITNSGVKNSAADTEAGGVTGKITTECIKENGVEKILLTATVTDGTKTYKSYKTIDKGDFEVVSGHTYTTPAELQSYECADSDIYICDNCGERVDNIGDLVDVDSTDHKYIDDNFYSVDSAKSDLLSDLNANVPTNLATGVNATDVTVKAGDLPELINPEVIWGSVPVATLKYQCFNEIKLDVEYTKNADGKYTGYIAKKVSDGVKEFSVSYEMMNDASKLGSDLEYVYYVEGKRWIPAEGAEPGVENNIYYTTTMPTAGTVTVDEMVGGVKKKVSYKVDASKVTKFIRDKKTLNICKIEMKAIPGTPDVSCTDDGTSSFEVEFKLFQGFDANGKETYQSVKNGNDTFAITKLNHDSTNLVPAKAETCTTNGNKAFYRCKNEVGVTPQKKTAGVDTEHIDHFVIIGGETDGTDKVINTVIDSSGFIANPDLIMIAANTSNSSASTNNPIEYRYKKTGSNYELIFEDSSQAASAANEFIYSESDHTLNKTGITPIPVVLKDAMVYATNHGRTGIDLEAVNAGDITLAAQIAAISPADKKAMRLKEANTQCGKYKTFDYTYCADCEAYIVIKLDSTTGKYVNVEVKKGTAGAKLDEFGYIVASHVNPAEKYEDIQQHNWDIYNNSGVAWSSGSKAGYTFAYKRDASTDRHYRECNVPGCGAVEEHIAAGEYIATSKGHYVFKGEATDCEHDGCDIASFQYDGINDVLTGAAVKHPHNFIDENASIKVCGDCGYSVINNTPGIQAGDAKLSTTELTQNDVASTGYRQSYKFDINSNGGKIVSYGVAYNKKSEGDVEVALSTTASGYKIDSPNGNVVVKNAIKTNGTLTVNLTAADKKDIVSVQGFVVYNIGTDAAPSYKMVTSEVKTSTFEALAAAECENACSVKVESRWDATAAKPVFEMDIETSEGYSIVSYGGNYKKYGVSAGNTYSGTQAGNGKITSNGTFTMTVSNKNLKDNEAIIKADFEGYLKVKDSYGITHELKCDASQSE